MSDANGPDAVLLLAFGGPEQMDEVRPFLRSVLHGRPVPPERFEEVVGHYAALGGRSPLPAITRRQLAALRAALTARGETLPVGLGMRHSAPSIPLALTELAAGGATRVRAVVLAAHESPASHGRYRDATAEALTSLSEAAPEVDFAPSFHAHPGFVRANVDGLLRARAAAGDAAPVIFTAHSIPCAVADRCDYVAQLAETARLVAAGAGTARYRIAYQSRSGSPRDPWLEPDVREVIREEAARGAMDVVVAPVGFVCDHMEVVYDLDVEAAEVARDAGIQLHRAATAGDHPDFIAALADLATRPWPT